MKVNFAVIGLGVISKYYLKAIQKNTEANLVAICDLNQDKLLGHSDLDKKSIKAYTDYHQLATEKLDFAVICLPNQLHFEVVKFFLENGVNVICEKPLTVNSEQAKFLHQFARDSSLILKTVYHRSYATVFLKLLEKIGSEKIKYVSARYLENIFEHSGNDKWQIQPDAGGGCVIDNGVNVMHCLWKLHGEFSIRDSIIGSVNEKVETYSVIEIAYLDGIKGIIELDWKYEGEKKDLYVYLEKTGMKELNFISNLYLGRNNEEFKGSLWHEYENAISEITEKFQQKELESSIEDIFLLDCVEKIYAKSFVN